MCWADYGTDVASACCSRSHSQDGGATACPVALLDSAFPLELCCLGPSAAEAPLRGCEAPLQEALVAADGTVDVPAVLQAEPVRLFDDFIYVVIRFFFGGLLNSRFVRIWQAIEKSGEAARELCPVAHALSQLLRAEFELAASLPVLGGGLGAWALSSARRDGLLAAARGSALGGAASSALLHAAHRRVALWEAALGARAPPAGGGGAAEASCPPAVAALPPFACRALQAWAAVGAAEPWGDGPRRAAGTASVVDLWRGGFACARWERRTGQASREEPRPGRGFVPAPLVDGGSEDLLRREVRWLERASLRRSPNPLCWTPERRQRGLTPELCCGQPGRLTVDAQACWDAVYSAGPCCSRPAGHRCGDLVLAAASDGVRTWETDDVLREFHGALAGELLWASRGVGREAAPGDDGPPLEALAALASLWPEADLKERCPEAWALARLLDLVAPGAPGAAELAGDPRSRELLEVYGRHGQSFTQLPVLLLASQPGGEWLSDALRAAAGSRAALPAGDLDTGSAEWTGHPTSKVEHAWRSALEQCASAVCSWNAVEEDAAAGAACSGIPVRSEHGGVGRTTAFGRALWCAAQLTPARLAIDLYGGEGDTAVLLADGLRAQAGGDGLLATFEADVGRARRVSARLAARGVAVREVLLPPGGVVGAEVERAFQEAAQQGGVGAVVFAGRTSTTVLNEGRSVLAAACGRAGGLGLVLLDPDVEMGPHEFAEDWRALERCGPLATAIYNTNLPGGAGWVRERLVHAGGHREVLAGFNDGGSGEADVLYQLRAWSLLVLGSARLPGVAGADGGRAALPPQAGGASAEQDLEQMRVLSSMESGASWIGATFRSTRGGAVKKVHSAVEGIVPVQMLRPTDELLAPPAVDTNPHACFSELNSDAADYRFRVPCFLTCEGPDFDSSWGDFRRLVHQNAKDGYPPDEVLFGTASRLIADVAFNDSALILGRSRFMSRLRHEFTTDGHLEAFCLYGIASALFVRARTFLSMDPPQFMNRGQVRSAPVAAMNDLELAFATVSDSDTLAGLEFSFLENSGWPVRVEDIIVNIEAQRRSLGSPFVASLGAAAAGAGPGWGAPPVLGRSDAPVLDLELPPRPFRICGVGDHLAATFDVMLMAEESLRLAGHRTVQFERALLGRYCPLHQGQQHQCRQRCQLLGAGCGAGGEADDPVEQWLARVIHPETLDELPFDLAERRERLAGVVRGDPRLSGADLLVCSHPVLLCVLLADVSERPVFAHASSTLLYGLPCLACGALASSTLSVYSDGDVHEYFSGLRRSLGCAAPLRSGTAQPTPRLALLAEGRFLAEQIWHHARIDVQWAPPLALYASGRWRGGERRSAVVLRSRFFVTLMGEGLRSLIREFVSINSLAADITFLGQDNQFDEQWLTLEQIASFGAAILYPNDLHQRTFHEVYKMGVPLLMPDALGLYRTQRAANWGYASYGVDPGAPAEASDAACAAQPRPGRGPREAAAVPWPPWWNSFNATPDVVVHFQSLADWEQLPHVQRFASLPGLLETLLTVDLAGLSNKMLEFHAELTQDSLRLVASHVLRLLRS